MRKILSVILGALIVMAVMPAVMAASQEFPVNTDPIGPGNPGPNVHLIDRDIDIGIDTDGSGSSINPSDIRNHNYAFMGEKIYYSVLVRDDNGAADIKTVRWVRDGSDEMGPCDDITGMYSVEEIAEATNLDYDNQTDRVYECVLEVESTWSGEDTIYVQATDQQDEMGQTLSERWTFNPPLTVSVETSDGEPLTFGEVIKDQNVPGTTAPNCEIEVGDGGLTSRNCNLYSDLPEGQKLCDISFSENQLVIRNTGSVVDLWPFIAATQFEDSDGMAKCPDDNSLMPNQFEYRAIQGSWDSGWRVMPQYSPNLACEGPIGDDTCRGGCRITEGCPIDVLGPGQSTDVRLKVVWPTPCIGNFDTGNIYAIVRAV